ncbi:carbohydrate kinase [Oleiagrimonas sp. C23AA]|uniref:carbohydrate kinase family protein n=1 Tax=Oleiagrimonas sp. C23AA TaxID=2719047 RepID=UPI001423FF3C|nr:carbohydrate kinase [Oleiagrimonas sp. C23AA]NII09937.1 carbohydrate kinase [Oleiagrimonas sp. C23AA]
MRTTLCFGEALIDFHAQPPATPDAPPAYLPFAGGAPANVAVAVAKLGGDAAFIGMLGADAFGDLLAKSLGEAGVDMQYVTRTDEANTALAFVSLDANGERSFTFYRPPAADLLYRAEDFPAPAFERAGIFHVCSNSLTEAGIAATTLEGMARAHATGTLVSFDMNLRPALWPRNEDPTPRLWQALHAADVVKLSTEELDFLAQPLSGEAAVLAKLWQGRARWLVITDGDAPIRWFTPDSDGTLTAYKVPAVDTTGAGDAFVGGLIYGLEQAGVTPDSLGAFVTHASQRDDVLRFAAACGAVAVSRRGSFEAMPTPETARQLMAEHA